MKPLSCKELFTLGVGDRFIVYWAKDDNPEYVRLNYKTQTIASKEKGMIYTKDGYDWYESEVISMAGNELNTSRGIARFYKWDKKR